MIEPVQVAFVCVQNAGRSQMAYAFAQRELARRGLSEQVTVQTGGTNPAAELHVEVIKAMEAVGIDISNRKPREISLEDIRDSEYVITMGCSATEVCPAGWVGETRDWALEDPAGQPAAAVAAIRDEVNRRVRDLFDELERSVA